MCLWIYQGERFSLSLELPLIYRAEDSSFIFYTTIIFGEILEHYYLETLIFLHHKCLNILIIRHALCQTYVCIGTGENFISVVKLVFNPIVYI